ncbi:MAG: PilZ domain-containing protein [Phycisphaeraceae bacterium]|nr:PilZ domain-containing protein [Phycisphaeraceae bacterium]
MNTDAPFQLRRRQEHRAYCCDDRVAWRIVGSTSLRPGRLRDVSRSGFGLLVPIQLAPRTGDALALLVRNQASPSHCRVVRVARCKDGGVLVGCRRVSSEDRRSTRARARALPNGDARRAG